jgi:excisionase family DNA binding protein
MGPAAEQLHGVWWLTKQQAADALGCDARTVRRLVLKGYLPSYGVGRLVRFKPAEVAACLPRLTAATPVAEPGVVALDLTKRLKLKSRYFYRGRRSTQPGGAV